MNIRVLVTAAIMVVAVARCQTTPQQTTEVYLSALKYIVDLGLEKSELYFVSIGVEKRDPSETFLSRAQKFAPGVRPYSTRSSSLPFAEAKSGRSGISIEIGPIKPGINGRVRVNCDVFTANGRGSRGVSLILENRGDQWVVTDSQLGWIS